MSVNQTGEPAWKLAVRELGNKIFGNFGLVKAFEGNFVA
jgi:hypothetical protein